MIPAPSPFAETEPQISDQARRARETGCAENRSKYRRIPWRMEAPAFVSRMWPTPYDLTQHAATPNLRIFIVGQPMTASEVLTHCEQTAKHVYARGQHFPSVTAHNGARITYAGSWFGASDYGPRDAALCWDWLETKCRQAWRDDTVRLLMTPATTGRDLWARTIDSHGYGCLSRNDQGIIRPTGGQGRMETFGRDDTISDLYEYDGRMAYVALMDELPLGTPDELWSTAARSWWQANPYLEGRYEVSWKAPRGWDRPGVLAAHGDVTDWCWPLQGRGWAGGAELFAAEKLGWNLTIHRAYVWPCKGSPLRVWRNRLLKVLAESEGLENELHRGMLRAAIRALLLHTVGAFFGAPHWVTRCGEYPPENARRIRMMANGQLTWEQPEDAAWPEMVHPEWTVTIWGRARARLVLGHRGQTGMMTVPPQSLVAFRTDAIYTTTATGWDELDNGTPGRYRMKRYQFDQAQAWPTNGPELLDMKGRAL